jgi:hypothetical protein
VRQIETALARRKQPLHLFFRDDDAGWAMNKLAAMIDIFGDQGCHVDLAVIPAVLDESSASQLNKWRSDNTRIGLHQHGYAHVNHEPALARKCEFGPARPIDRQCADIMIGRARMTGMLGDTDPIFTPPWNRCSPDTIAHLGSMGFAMFSNDRGRSEDGETGIATLPVSFDWDRARRDGYLEAALADEITNAAAPVGVMLHHATLDQAGCRTLDRVLSLLVTHENVCIRPMRHWIGEKP